MLVEILVCLIFKWLKFSFFGNLGKVVIWAGNLKGSDMSWEFDSPIYMPVDEFFVETIELYIKSSQGSQLLFENGTTICVLYLRKVWIKISASHYTTLGKCTWFDWKKCKQQSCKDTARHKFVPLGIGVLLPWRM